MDENTTNPQTENRMDKVSDSNSRSGEIWVLDFTPRSAAVFREEVLRKSRLNPESPIVVNIDSYGGNVDALAKMVETIENVPNPIITCCMGKAMSAGAILLSCGDMRYIGKHSRVMIHQVSGGTMGNPDDMLNDAEEIYRMGKHFIGLLAQNSIFGTYTKLAKFLKDLDGSDLYLDAEAAVEYGIVDEIGIPLVHGQMLFQVVLTPEKDIVVRGEEAEEPKTKKPKSKKKKRKNTKSK